MFLQVLRSLVRVPFKVHAVILLFPFLCCPVSSNHSQYVYFMYQRRAYLAMRRLPTKTYLDYSDLNVVAGSTRAARHAGTQQAIAETLSSNATTLE